MGMKTCQGTDSIRLPRRAVGAAKLLKINNTVLAEGMRVAKRSAQNKRCPAGC